MKNLATLAIAEYVGAAFADLTSRVARWFVFKPKIPIWVNFGGP
jgi:hypothetical protein